MVISTATLDRLGIRTVQCVCGIDVCLILMILRSLYTFHYIHLYTTHSFTTFLISALDSLLLSAQVEASTGGSEMRTRGRLTAARCATNLATPHPITLFLHIFFFGNC
jgi:hypothetical protein